MAGKKYVKRPRRTMRKRRVYRRRRVVAFRNPVKRGGFPDTYFTPFTYTTQALGMGDNTGLGYQRVITMNDPTNNNTLAPLGWIVLRDIYDTFLVHACKIKLTFQNTSATIPCRLVLAPMDADSSNISQTATAINASTFGLIAQSPYAKVYNLSAMGGGKDTVTLSRTLKIGKYAGIRKLSVKDERYLGNTGGTESSRSFTQPTAIYRWVYAVITATGVNLSTNMVFVSSEVTWYTQLLERLAAADG